MSGILELLNSPMGKQLIEGISQESGEPEEDTADVLSMAMPLLLGAMKKNASSPEGAKGLMDALSSKHTGGILEDLGGLFGGGLDTSVKQDGAGILRHVLGGKQPAVESALSQKSGMDPAAIASILQMAAPIILGFLGRQKAQSNVSDAGGLNTLLGSMLGGQPHRNQSLIESLIDTDGDGSVLDDVADMVLGSKQSKKGGLGGLLGGLFGK
ncbi:DUF937 domain-containing protein [Robiginitalea sp. SC105]|uniref:DUF937 domain-containing protein n=1 Tax=Robiginitalea sp. SC105 TaxID=2762332 RepID=UPI00163B2F82|nr:DUF937 domain-containing protein [Robiginitalea sp. SC105]MBC2840642.1 DUF937 domain-containing protein [Robiginitalea sp. SC105]